jgi:hypothetical protein
MDSFQSGLFSCGRFAWIGLLLVGNGLLSAISGQAFAGHGLGFFAGSGFACCLGNGVSNFAIFSLFFLLFLPFYFPYLFLLFSAFSVFLFILFPLL